MNIWKYRRLKYYILSKKFFTHKKYFFYRHCLVTGATIAYYDYYTRKQYGLFSLFDKWSEVIIFPFVCFLLGLFFNAITYTLADIFCKDKTIEKIKH